MSMILRRGTIRGGQVVVEEPIDLPDGSEVTIFGGEGGPALPDLDEPASSLEQVMKRFGEIDFMTEEQQTDEPETLQRWIEELRSIPPVPEEPEREAESRAWDETMRRFNIEAVRKQFEEDQA
jgi:hypothetical protein